MAGEQGGGSGGGVIYYWSNNGIDTNKVASTDTTAPGFGHGSYLISFTRPSGKSFIKWNTVADGSGTDYFPGDDVSHLLGQESDLYAIWGDIPLMVQKSSIEDIADAVRGKDITLSSSSQTLASLPDAITNLPGLVVSTTGTERLYGGRYAWFAVNGHQDWTVDVMLSGMKGHLFVFMTTIGIGYSTPLSGLVVVGIPDSSVSTNEGYRLNRYTVCGNGTDYPNVASNPRLTNNNGTLQLTFTNNTNSTYYIGYASNSDSIRTYRTYSF